MAHFGSIFPVFGVKKIFLENPALSCTTSNGFPAPCQNLEEVNDTIQRKHLDRQKDGQKDGRKDWQKDRQILFYRKLLATTGGPIKVLLHNHNPLMSKLLKKSILVLSKLRNRFNKNRLSKIRIKTRQNVFVSTLLTTKKGYLYLMA